MLMQQLFAAVDHFQRGHVARQMSEIPADQGQDRSPDPRPEGGEERKAAQAHPRQPGRNGDQLPDRGEQSADERRQVAVFPEDLLRAVQMLFLQEEIFAVFMQEGPAQPGRKEIIDIGSEHGTGQTDHHRQDEIQP